MKKSYFLAAVIAVAAAGWILSGQFTEPAEEKFETASVPAAPKHALPSVRTQTSSAQEQVREILVRGHTEAKRRVTLKAELKGKIAQIARHKGDMVKAGEVIARIEIKDRQAWLDEAQATARQREIEYQAADKRRSGRPGPFPGGRPGIGKRRRQVARRRTRPRRADRRPGR
jgi:multidrug efflux system membrane fusion protein